MYLYSKLKDFHMKKSLAVLLFTVPFTVFAAGESKPSEVPVVASTSVPKADVKTDEKAKPKVKRPEERKTETNTKKSTETKPAEPAAKK